MCSNKHINNVWLMIFSSLMAYIYKTHKEKSSSTYYREVDDLESSLVALALGAHIF